MRNATIISTGIYLPKKRITNAEHFEGKTLYPFDGKGNEPVITSDVWITDRMGIKERRYADPSESVDDLGSYAAKMALESVSFPIDELTGIICATIPQGSAYPTKASRIHEKIKAPSKCSTYDINAACAGFVYALDDASDRIRSRGGYWLVVASEIMSRGIDKDGVNSPLFGDGAGAALLGPSNNNKGIIDSTYITDSDRGDLLYQTKNGYLWMDGRSVYKIAVQRMTEAVRKIQNKLGWQDFDLLIPHQANKRILETICKNIGLPDEKVFCNIENYGNMSSASCAVAFHEALSEKKIKEGSKVIMVAIGGGLVTASIGIQF